MKLEKVEHLYTELFVETLNFESFFDEDRLLSYVMERERILQEISKEELDLSGAKKNKTIYSEEDKLHIDKIKLMIQKINESDKVVLAKIKHRMSEIKNEITGLQKTSKAAIAYSSQARI